MIEIIKQNKSWVMLTIIIILSVSAAYFSTPRQYAEGMYGGNTQVLVDRILYEGIKLKILYEENGEHIDIYALMKSEALLKFGVIEGTPVPDPGSISIGYDEAMMMIENEDFEKVGDTVTEFGRTLKVGGVIKPTMTFIDHLHFVNHAEFSDLRADERAYVKFTDDNVPKLFYPYDLGEEMLVKVELIEGTMENYRISEINGDTYYPLIIGSKEAKMMKDEKLFVNVGDPINDFFGQRVIVVGIFEETGTATDMIHVVPTETFKFSGGVLV
jgi:hypothetical protein